MTGAVFCDVEGTLVNGTVGRIVYDAGQQHHLFSSWQTAQIVAIAALARCLPRIRRTRLLAFSTTRFVMGWDDTQVQRLLDAALPALVARLKPHTERRLRAHQQAGLPLILMTGVIQPVAEGLAQALGGQAEGTYLVKRDGRYTGRYDGPMCNGQAKAARVRQVMQTRGYAPTACHAYGDTSADIPYLSLCGHAYAVDPDPVLRAEAMQRNWAVVLAEEP